MAVSTDEKSRAKLVLTTDGEHEMIIALDMSRIPIPQVAAATGLAEPIVRHLVNAGVIAGAGELCDLDKAKEIAGQLAAARALVDGQGILGPDAASKYGFDVGSLYRWQRDGWIRPLIDRQRNRVFNEGDIAFARTLADLVGHMPGRAVFPAKPRSGRPRKLAS